ncbi:unnamed protein product, partial [Polarella glacialis]
ASPGRTHPTSCNLRNCSGVSLRAMPAVGQASVARAQGSLQPGGHSDFPADLSGSGRFCDC